MTNFNNRLRKLRLYLDLKQVEMAEKIGINRVTLNKWERGIARPQFEELVKILDTYPKVDARWLLVGEGEMFISGNAEELRGIKNKLMNAYEMNNLYQNQIFKYQKLHQECITKYPECKEILTNFTNEQV